MVRRAIAPPIRGRLRPPDEPRSLWKRRLETESGSVLGRWRQQFGLAVSLKLHEQCEQRSDTCWTCPASDGSVHYITVLNDRVASCSCSEGYGGRWRVEYPCLHAVAVLAALHVTWWQGAGLTFDWLPGLLAEGFDAAWSVVTPYLPLSVCAERKGAA